MSTSENRSKYPMTEQQSTAFSQEQQPLESLLHVKPGTGNSTLHERLSDPSFRVLDSFEPLPSDELTRLNLKVEENPQSPSQSLGDQLLPLLDLAQYRELSKTEREGLDIIVRKAFTSLTLSQQRKVRGEVIDVTPTVQRRAREALKRYEAWKKEQKRIALSPKAKTMLGATAALTAATGCVRAGAVPAVIEQQTPPAIVEQATKEQQKQKLTKIPPLPAEQTQAAPNAVITYDFPAVTQTKESEHPGSPLERLIEQINKEGTYDISVFQQLAKPCDLYLLPPFVKDPKVALNAMLAKPPGCNAPAILTPETCGITSLKDPSVIQNPDEIIVGIVPFIDGKCMFAVGPEDEICGDQPYPEKVPILVDGVGESLVNNKWQLYPPSEGVNEDITPSLR